MIYQSICHSDTWWWSLAKSCTKSAPRHKMLLIIASYTPMKRACRSLLYCVMKTMSLFVDSYTPVAPFGAGQLCCHGNKLLSSILWRQFYPWSAEKPPNFTELRVSLAPAGTSLMIRIPSLPAVISSSVFCHGFLFHRLAVIFHSHQSRPSCCCDERCMYSWKSFSEIKNVARFHGTLYKYCWH